MTEQVHDITDLPAEVVPSRRRKLITYAAVATAVAVAVVVVVAKTRKNDSNESAENV